MASTHFKAERSNLTGLDVLVYLFCSMVARILMLEIVCAH